MPVQHIHASVTPVGRNVPRAMLLLLARVDARVSPYSIIYSHRGSISSNPSYGTSNPSLTFVTFNSLLRILFSDLAFLVEVFLVPFVPELLVLQPHSVLFHLPDFFFKGILILK